MIDPQNARKVDQQHQNTTNSELFYGTNQQISVYDDYRKHMIKYSFIDWTSHFHRSGHSRNHMALLSPLSSPWTHSLWQLWNPICIQMTSR